MFELRLGIVLLAAMCASWGPAWAQGRAAPDMVKVVENRQALMARMLDAVNQVSPRLGVAGAEVNPAHWAVIRENLEVVRSLLGESEAMWPPRSNLGWGSATRALPGLWTLRDAFQRHYDEAQAAFPVLEAALAAEDAAAARDGFCRLVATCGRCHGAFRKIDYTSLYREGPQWLGRFPGCADPAAAYP